MEDEQQLTAHAGLLLVVETARALRIDDGIRQHLRVRLRNSGKDEQTHLETLLMTLAGGGDCIDDVRIVGADRALQALWGREAPSADAVRQFLYRFHDEQRIEQARQSRPAGQEAYIPAENEALLGLGRLNTFLMHEFSRHQACRRATLDHDATILESHKREALPHYKGGRGYQPAAIYWVEQDWIVADEYRDGNVPAAMANLDLVRRAFALLPACVEERYFRADSACYDERVLKWLADEDREGGPKGRIGFSISADMTEALRRRCEALVEQSWTLVEERADETVMCAEVEFTPGDWPKSAAPLRYLALRFRKNQGELFATGRDTRYLAVVTNRSSEELSGPGLIHWHWQKAGTIERVHDVTKNDLAAAVPPCGRFGANAAWYRLNLITYNLLSAQKQLALPPSYADARPKRIRFGVFTLPGRVVRHGRQLVLKIGRTLDTIAGFVVARRRLLALRCALPSTA